MPFSYRYHWYLKQLAKLLIVFILMLETPSAKRDFMNQTCLPQHHPLNTMRKCLDLLLMYCSHLIKKETSKTNTS